MLVSFDHCHFDGKAYRASRLVLARMDSPGNADGIEQSFSIRVSRGRKMFARTQPTRETAGYQAQAAVPDSVMPQGLF
jgi:hypothetical protein